MQISPMVTVTRGRFGPAPAQVLEQVRALRVAHRDELAARTGLSVATIGRAVGQLTDAGVLRERPDKIRRTLGRPGIPVEVDPTRFVIIGIHLGRRIATVAIGDLTGKLLSHETTLRAPGAAPDLDALSRIAARLLGELGGRAPLAASLVGPWLDLGLDGIDQERLSAELHDLTGLEVRSGDHIAAVAASEFFHRRHGTPGATLYVYARDSIGFAVAIDKGEQTEVSRVGSLTHFPVGSPVACPCGRTGCLAVTAGDEAIVREAATAGLIDDAQPAIGDLYAAAGSGNEHALDLLRERGRILGDVTGAVRDIVVPDRVVLVGQAFTGCPPALRAITDAYAAAGSHPEIPVSFTRFGSGIQAIAACTIALGPVYDDPMAIVPRPVRESGIRTGI